MICIACGSQVGMFYMVLLFGYLFFGRLDVRDHWVCPHSINHATTLETIPVGKMQQENHFKSNNEYGHLLGDLSLARMGLFCH